MTYPRGAICFFVNDLIPIWSLLRSVLLNSLNAYASFIQIDYLQSFACSNRLQDLVIIIFTP